MDPHRAEQRCAKPACGFLAEERPDLGGYCCRRHPSPGSLKAPVHKKDSPLKSNTRAEIQKMAKQRAAEKLKEYMNSETLALALTQFSQLRNS